MDKRSRFCILMTIDVVYLPIPCKTQFAGESREITNVFVPCRCRFCQTRRLRQRVSKAAVYRFAPCPPSVLPSERTPPVFSAQDVSPPGKGTPEQSVRIHFPSFTSQIWKAGSLPTNNYLRGGLTKRTNNL